MTLEGDNYDKAAEALGQAWVTINEPAGQADDVEGNRLPWAGAAVGVGIGHALLGLGDELRKR